MFGKNTSGCLRCLFLMARDKCCGELDYDIPASTGSWKKLDKSKKKKEEEKEEPSCNMYQTQRE